jgi:hypothetical protein
VGDVEDFSVINDMEEFFLHLCSVLLASVGSIIGARGGRAIRQKRGEILACEDTYEISMGCVEKSASNAQRKKNPLGEGEVDGKGNENTP